MYGQQSGEMWKRDTEMSYGSINQHPFASLDTRAHTHTGSGRDTRNVYCLRDVIHTFNTDCLVANVFVNFCQIATETLIFFLIDST